MCAHILLVTHEEMKCQPKAKRNPLCNLNHMMEKISGGKKSNGGKTVNTRAHGEALPPPRGLGRGRDPGAQEAQVVRGSKSRRIMTYARRIMIYQCVSDTYHIVSAGSTLVG